MVERLFPFVSEDAKGFFVLNKVQKSKS